jgi:hypothetical protein
MDPILRIVMGQEWYDLFSVSRPMTHVGHQKSQFLVFWEAMTKFSVLWEKICRRHAQDSLGHRSQKGGTAKTNSHFCGKCPCWQSLCVQSSRGCIVVALSATRYILRRLLPFFVVRDFVLKFCPQNVSSTFIEPSPK